MMQYFEKLLYWNEYIQVYKEEKANYMGNISQEARSDNSKFINELSKICSCSERLFEYDYRKDCILHNGRQYDLKHDIRLFLDDIDREYPLILNMTSLTLRALGALLFHIKKLEFQKVHCIYTEPLRYCKNVSSEESSFLDRFDLYKEFRGIEAIPGFLRENCDNLRERWIAFLGFEGKRMEQIHEKYEFDSIVPVVTLPSYQPGWHNYTIEENLDLIKKVDRKPEYVIANSFISAYDYLQRVLETSPDTFIRISPLGTKINALGVLLFSLNNTERVEVLYDNPITAGRISEGCGSTYVFDISEIINENCSHD